MLSRILPANKVPPAVRSFLVRALICFISWQLIYQVFLKPERKLDKQVTYLTALSTSAILSAAYGNAAILSVPPKEVITINGKRIIGIADGCNALELFVLYGAFLLCMPGSGKRRAAFALIGIPSIYLLNVLRCCGIAWLHLNYPQMVDFAHHYVFAVIVYGFIFFMLTKYTKNMAS